MNRCYPFQGVGSSGPPPTSLSRWGSLTELLWHYAPTHRRIIWCWRTLRQNLTICIFKSVGWTAAPPSVHPVLKLQSWRVSILIQMKRRIDRRCPHSGRQIIRCYYLCCSSSAIHPAHLETWINYTNASDGVIFILPHAQCTNYTDAMHRWCCRFIRRCLFPSFSSRLQLGSLLQLNILNILNIPLLIALLLL
jgi:hypothetical protein